MVKIIKLGVGGISKKLWLNIFLLIEVIVIIVASNIMISNMNSKKVLYKPFEYMMNNDGFIYTNDDFIEDVSGSDVLKTLKKVEKKLKGEYTIHRVYERNDRMKVTANKSLFVNVSGFETEFYENMNIPLSEGSWNLTSEDGEIVECVICPNNLGIGVGSILKENELDGENVTYKVVGVLANPTYRPVPDYSANSCDKFFESYDVKDTLIDDPDLFIYVNGKKISQFSGTYVGSGEFVTYNKPVGPDIIKYNNTVLGRKGFYYSIKEFKSNSQKYITKMQKKVFPIMCGVMIVVMVGIVSASMIQTMSQMRQYGVFYLCGASRMKCILMTIIGNILTYVISVVVSFCIVVTVYNTELRTKIGMVMEINNIWITLFIMVMLVVMSIVVPFVMLKVKSIKEILIKHEE
ncbi:MAG: hypothetical protein MSA21_03905 [Lachnospiraceae bacterium]|nr:hypothetical protein [Lachnospiraceae bacterium]